MAAFFRGLAVFLVVGVIALIIASVQPRDDFPEFNRISSPDGNWTVRFRKRWNSSYCEAWAEAYDSSDKCIGKKLIGKYEEWEEPDFRFQDAHFIKSRVQADTRSGEWMLDMGESDFRLSRDQQ